MIHFLPALWCWLRHSRFFSLFLSRPGSLLLLIIERNSHPIFDVPPIQQPFYIIFVNFGGFWQNAPWFILTLKITFESLGKSGKVRKKHRPSHHSPLWCGWSRPLGMPDFENWLSGFELRAFFRHLAFSLARVLYFLLSEAQLVKGKKQSRESKEKNKKKIKNLLLTKHSTNSCKLLLVFMRIDIFYERK